MTGPQLALVPEPEHEEVRDYYGPHNFLYAIRFTDGAVTGIASRRHTGPLVFADSPDVCRRVAAEIRDGLFKPVGKDAA